MFLIIAFTTLIIPHNSTAIGGEGSRIFTFEGTLLTYSPHPGYGCGDLYPHQIAKYRVEKVLNGYYSDEEIVIDHPACHGDVFNNIPIGTSVNIEALVLKKYDVITAHPGIREIKQPRIFYVATTPPLKRI